MNLLILRFVNIMMVALVAGTVFAITVGFNPKTLSAPAYVEMQQLAIKSLNTLMPLLGLITIIITFLSAFLHRNDKPVFILLLTGAGFLIISGLITKFGNQPINSIVMTWDKHTVPADWTSLRDHWWNLHLFRTATSIAALGLIIYSYLKR